MGLIGGIARTAVVAGTWTAVSNEVSRRQAGRWAAQEQHGPQPAYMPPPPGWRYKRAFIQQAAARSHQPPPVYQPAPVYQPPPVYQPAPVYQPPPAPVPPAADMSTKLAQLRQLGDLKAEGILTEEEFQAQKSAILGPAA